MSLRTLSLSELAEILMESALEKKPLIKAMKPAEKQEPEQLEEAPANPAEKPPVQTASSPASPVGDGAASSLQSKPISFELNRSNIIQAVVFSELLTEPVCKKRRRGRRWS